MIRLVSGTSASGHLMMNAVNVPTTDPGVAERITAGWAELEGWTNVSVRTPDAGSVHHAVVALASPERLRELLTLWEERT